jgi:glycerol kinase
MAMTEHEKYVAAIDQGTTSSRCIIFDQDGAMVAVDQREHRQIFPRPGWVEHDATEIWSKVQAVVAGALAKAGLRADRLSALGITNQRETTVLWDRATGKPVHNAIVWQDTRTAALCGRLGGTDGQDRFRETDRAAAGQLLLRAEGRLAARQRARSAGPGGAR